MVALIFLLLVPYALICMLSPVTKIRNLFGRRILIFPKGNKVVNHLSIYIDVADSGTLPSGWSRFAQFECAVIDQIDRRNSISKASFFCYNMFSSAIASSYFVLAILHLSALRAEHLFCMLTFGPGSATLLLSAVTKHEFNAKEPDWGFASFLPHSVLHDPERGYLVNDACLVEAYVSTGETQGLISHEFILENDSDKHETKGDDGVKAAIDNQTTMKTEAAIEPEDPTDEDMNTFFSSLESELLSSKIIVSREEAEEAVAKLEDVMNMTPVDFYNSSRFSTLKQPFKILASFNCSSTTLTIEQKNKLLAMEESMKELADRAAKAVEDMNHLSEKQSMKLTITHSLDSNVVRYKEMESEVKRVEQKLAAFHEQVEEAQKEMESMLAERKGIFRSSKRMKVELEALEKKWAEYEAKAEVAETEEKTVEAEWERMKDFISSIKGKI
ncbi:hypothetical protein V6N11_054213 [Hibiscus sabdariffa]|uniref:MATH domain-containing protein n=2 Tax=Hibiscus sabdariffa TaxID=183260 RepID=A0ABR2S3T8_9ROSI